MGTSKFVEEINRRFFNNELSDKFQAELNKIPIDRPDVFAMVERMFGYIKASGIPAQDMSLLLGELLGSLLARILPEAWEGRVPPVTVAGRHQAIDRYIKSNQWIKPAKKKMLDIGCGFPPYTTIDTAQFFPEWHITGADPSLPQYLVYDEVGNYATFDKNKSTVYFQPVAPTIENWNVLLEDAAATKNGFEKLLNELINAQSESENGLPRLEHNPIQAYETDNLTFVHGGIGQIDIEAKDVIRCFNVLFYFDDIFYENALTWFCDQLQEDGLLFIGGNWAVSSESYYNVYQKKDGQLINRAFVFGLDCICPFGIASWYANHDDDRQTAELVKYVKVIRQDNDFLNRFYKIHDAQRLKYGLCPRDDQGYYGALDSSITPEELWPLVGKMLEELNEAGMNQEAANVLQQNGFNARINGVGHIEINF
ncbi:MAG: hypothetical protein KJP00_11240 [Bacteroidia bacterium]|nr:hypothetical protein [Bacteroidia bacterium]